MYRKNKRYFPTRVALPLFILLCATFALIITVPLLREEIPVFDRLIIIGKTILGIRILTLPISGECKASWLFIILVFPTVGICAYFLFYRARPTKKELCVIKETSKQLPKRELLSLSDTEENFEKYIASLASRPIYRGTDTKYIESASLMKEALLRDIKRAKSFIFIEFYTIATGEFFGEIYDALKEKASHGVEVRIIFDELGSIMKLPFGFFSDAERHGIRAVSYLSFCASFPSGLNNRNHRKIVVIDGEAGYTGGINLADEYIYSKKRLGEWKDCAIRISGEAVNELTYLFLSDFSMLTGDAERESFFAYYKYRKKSVDGATVLFGDGPRSLYKRSISKSIIIALLIHAKREVTLTTPYLICDGDVMAAIESAAGRGVRVKIIIPSKPDRRATFLLTKLCAARLAKRGAEIYRYVPGFLHAKIYLCDQECAMLGSVNLDYRSLEHNLENGICLFGGAAMPQIKNDTENILSVSEKMSFEKTPLSARVLGAIMQIFAPLF